MEIWATAIVFAMKFDQPKLELLVNIYVPRPSKYLQKKGQPTRYLGTLSP